MKVLLTPHQEKFVGQKFQPCRTLPLVVVLISATISSVAGTFGCDSRLRQNAMMSSLRHWLAGAQLHFGVNRLAHLRHAVSGETRERSTAG
jgi:hypothetical protein